MRDIHCEPLTREAFATFGDVVETDGRASHPINKGRAQRFHDLAEVDTSSGGGRPGISLVVAQVCEDPSRVHMLERHPLASQAFIPASRSRFLVVVAPAGDGVDAAQLRAFVTNGSQGINYRRGVWHQVLAPLDDTTLFLTVDRIGDGENCDRHFLDEPVRIVMGDTRGA